MQQPTLFLSHGAPDIAVRPDHPSNAFLCELGQQLHRPDAIVIFTAHWLTEALTVSSLDKYETIHDFGNFDARLYEIHYEPAGTTALATELAALVSNTGQTVHLDHTRGLDHGAWTPLALMYPEADIPVVQVSIQPHRSPEYHYRIGEAIASLRSQNILIIGSGAMTHSFKGLSMPGRDGQPPQWAQEFSDWMNEAAASGNNEALLHYRARAPYAEENHPSDEHLLPFFAAVGAGGGAPGQRLHSDSMYRTVMMDMYAFGQAGILSPVPEPRNRTTGGRTDG